jgi:hypothetical protein
MAPRADTSVRPGLTAAFTSILETRRGKPSLPDGFDSVEQLAGAQRQSYSAMAINFLKESAAAYGYEQQGNVWVYTGR